MLDLKQVCVVSMVVALAFDATATTSFGQAPETGRGGTSTQGGATQGGATQGGAKGDGVKDEEARNLFQAGRVAWSDERFEDALGYFERAFKLSQRPQLLYNIGVTAERLRRYERAVQALERYLAELPNADNRSEVEGRLSVMRDNLRKQADAPVEAQPEPDRSEARTEGASDAEVAEDAATERDAPPPAVDTTYEVSADGASWITQRPLTWVALGVGIASAGAATYFWMDANRAYRDLREACGDPGCTQAEIDASGGPRSLMWNRIFLVGSVLGFAGAATLFFLEGRDDTAGERAVTEKKLAVDVGVGTLQVRGHF